MLEKLMTEFVHYLRKSNIHVPTSSLEESMYVLSKIDILDREEVEMTLCQLWVKDFTLKEKFKECFQEFFFHRLRNQLADFRANEQLKEVERLKRQIVHRSQKEEEEEEIQEEPIEIKWFRTFVGKKGTNVSEFYRKVQEKEVSSGFSNLIEIAGKIKEENINSFAEDLTWDAIMNEQPAVAFGMIESLRNEVLNLYREVIKIKQMEHTIIEEREKEFKKGMREVVATEIDALKERPLNKLKAEDIKKLKESLERSSLALLTKFSKVLRKTLQEHQIDIKKTIANSLKTFGVPMELAYKKKIIKKTNIHIIMDVSGSVIKSAEILSLFSYLVYKQFPGQVRTFVFVGKLDETTSFYRIEDSEEAVKKSLLDAKIDYKGYSDYDTALSVYEKEYMKQINEDTIVFFLGDARNNKNKPRHHTVQKIKEKAKYVFWFNPEDQEKWNQGDSIIGKYAPHCDKVIQTTTTNELTGALEEIAEMVS